MSIFNLWTPLGMLPRILQDDLKCSMNITNSSLVKVKFRKKNIPAVDWGECDVLLTLNY